MTNEQFVEKIFGYYGMKAEVLEEVKDLTKHMSDDDRATLWDGMKYYVSPSKRIGVSDIFEMCAKKNLAVRNAAPVKLPVHDVTCEVCGNQYRWKLLTNKKDNENGIHERCRNCGFYYEDTWVVKRYEDAQYGERLKLQTADMQELPPPTYGNEHRKYIEKYRGRWQRGEYDYIKAVPQEGRTYTTRAYNPMVDGLAGRKKAI